MVDLGDVRKQQALGRLLGVRLNTPPAGPGQGGGLIAGTVGRPGTLWALGPGGFLFPLAATSLSSTLPSRPLPFLRLPRELALELHGYGGGLALGQVAATTQPAFPWLPLLDDAPAVPRLRPVLQTA